MATDEKKTCRRCRWHMWEEYGYSNYTVEGSYFHCLKKLHPEDGFDEFYGEDPRLDFAQTCGSFQVGEGVQLDCDREEEKDADLSAYTKDPEVAAALNAWNTE
jgi:hypothetical protein